MYSFTSSNRFVLNPVFFRVCSLFIIVLHEIKADGRKMHSIFFLILQKSKDNFFIVYVHKYKQTFNNSDYLHDRGVASTVGRGINTV